MAQAIPAPTGGPLRTEATAPDRRITDPDPARSAPRPASLDKTPPAAPLFRDLASI